MTVAPAGVIVGRITTESGEPLAFAEVEALRPQLDGNRRTLLPIGRAEGNARDEYRIDGLPPGRYYIAALDPDDLRTEDATGRIQIMQTLFPGVSTPGAAQRVEMSAGGTSTNVDFPLLGAARASVRGQLVHPDEAKLATGSVIMSPESDGGLGLGIASPAVVRPDGVFEFVNVPPGRYHLQASARTSVRRSYRRRSGLGPATLARLSSARACWTCGAPTWTTSRFCSAQARVSPGRSKRRWGRQRHSQTCADSGSVRPSPAAR